MDNIDNSSNSTNETTESSQVSGTNEGNSSVSGQEAVNNAGTKDGQPTKETAAQKQIKKLKLKVRGKEIEKEIDLGDDESLTKMLQLAENANYVTQKVRDKEKSLMQKEQELQELYGKKDLKNILQRTGMTKAELYDYLAEQEIEESLSPEEKEYMELKKEREARKAQEEEQKKKAEEEKYKEISTNYAKKVEQELLSLPEVQELFGEKKTDAAVDLLAQVANEMLIAKSQGFSLTTQEAYEEVKLLNKERFVREVGSMTDKALIDMIGKERFAKLNKAYLDGFSPTQNSSVNSEFKNSADRSLEAKPRKVVRPHQFFK